MHHITPEGSGEHDLWIFLPIQGNEREGLETVIYWVAESQSTITTVDFLLIFFNVP